MIQSLHISIWFHILRKSTSLFRWISELVCVAGRWILLFHHRNRIIPTTPYLGAYSINSSLPALFSTLRLRKPFFRESSCVTYDFSPLFLYFGNSQTLLKALRSLSLYTITIACSYAGFVELAPWTWSLGKPYEKPPQGVIFWSMKCTLDLASVQPPYNIAQRATCQKYLPYLCKRLIRSIREGSNTQGKDRDWWPYIDIIIKKRAWWAREQKPEERNKENGLLLLLCHACTTSQLSQRSDS